MKSFNMLTIALGVMVVLGGCQTSNQSSNNLYGYDFNSAKITFQVSGTTQGESRVVIQGDKKRIENKYISKDLNGNQQSGETLTIEDKDRIYSLDLVKKQGISFINPLFSELQKLTPEQRKARLVKEALTAGLNSEGKPVTLEPSGTETVAGQTCQIYKREYQEICLWNGIPLKTTTELPLKNIKIVSVATKIEFNAPVDEAEFAIPKDIQIQEVNLTQN